SPQPGQHAYTFTFRQRNGRLFRMNYLLFLPRSYNASDGQHWPLLVFLHGSREVGYDIRRLQRAVLPQMVEKNPDFPFVVLSPQAPTAAQGWYPALGAIRALLDELQNSLSLDPSRIYLTGLSMGGYGAWALAMADPQRFAAIVPVVGGYFYKPRQLCALKHKPIWVFGARRDRNVPLRASEEVVRALQACGGAPRFTIFEDADHDRGWQLAYALPELYEWLLEQRQMHSTAHQDSQVSP
ncbi:MAG: prolyl oligopeptidase family serine peptidase, partial [Thermoflexales bacterium]